MAKVRRYPVPDIHVQYKVNGRWQTYPLTVLSDFMEDLLAVKRDDEGNVTYHLKVEEYLRDMGQAPFFLVAATGLGKTVGVPPHSFLRQCEQYYKGSKKGAIRKDIPRVWIIEPRIPIAVSQMNYGNFLFSRFIREVSDLRVNGDPVLFGSITSATKRINPNAPVMFVTTGILGILAAEGKLIPGKDRVVIDEAHVTIEQNADVELAIAICRQTGVQVDYMSATVDTSNIEQALGVTHIIKADKRQYPIWMHNTGKPMEECVVDMIQHTLIEPDPNSEYFPKHGYPDYEEVIAAVLDTTPRAKGLLLIVNSFASERSDVATITKLIEDAPFNKSGPRIHVLTLASEVLRDPVRRERFEAQLKEVIKAKELYVLIATSVVEMGVTYDTLEFVATMDSGYENETIGDTTMPRQGFLGVNALLQRAGRVGRKKAGIAYITREAGAPYTQLSDTELNSGKLTFEPISFPLKQGSLVQLAMYSFVKRWNDPVAELTRLNLPSGIHSMPERVEEFLYQRKRLEQLGLAGSEVISELGKSMQKWVGMADLGYAVELQKALLERRFLDVPFWLVATALTGTGISDLLERDDVLSFPGLNDRSELLGLYGVVSYLVHKYGSSIDELLYESSSLNLELNKECNAIGILLKSVKALFKSISEILKTFCDINKRRIQYKECFGERQSITLDDIGLVPLTTIQEEQFQNILDSAVDRIEISLSQSQEVSGFMWKSTDGTKEGVVYPHQTCLQLRNGPYTARLMPYYRRGTPDVQWKAIHVQELLGADEHYYAHEAEYYSDQNYDSGFELDENNLFADGEEVESEHQAPVEQEPELYREDEDQFVSEEDESTEKVYAVEDSLQINDDWSDIQPDAVIVHLPYDPYIRTQRELVSLRNTYKQEARASVRSNVHRIRGFAALDGEFVRLHGKNGGCNLSTAACIVAAHAVLNFAGMARITKSSVVDLASMGYSTSPLDTYNSITLAMQHKVQREVCLMHERRLPVDVVLKFKYLHSSWKHLWYSLVLEALLPKGTLNYRPVAGSTIRDRLEVCDPEELVIHLRSQLQNGEIRGSYKYAIPFIQAATIFDQAARGIEMKLRLIYDPRIIDLEVDEPK